MTQNDVYFSCNIRPVKFQLTLVVSSILIKFWSFLGWLILTSHWWKGLPKGVKWNLKALQWCAGVGALWRMLSTRCMPCHLQTLSCNCWKVNFYFHYKQQQQQQKPTESCILINYFTSFILPHPFSSNNCISVCWRNFSCWDVATKWPWNLSPKGSPVKAFTSQPIWLAVIQQSLLNTNISYREAKASMAPWRNLLIPKCHSELTNISLCHKDREKRTASV